MGCTRAAVPFRPNFEWAARTAPRHVACVPAVGSWNSGSDRLLQHEQRRRIRIHWFHSSSSSPARGGGGGGGGDWLVLSPATAPPSLHGDLLPAKHRLSRSLSSLPTFYWTCAPRGDLPIWAWIGLFLLVTNPSLLGFVRNNTMEVRPMVALRAALVGGVAAFAKIGAAMKAAGGAKVGAAAAAMTAAATAAISSKDTNKDNPKTETK
uniref:Uncharacterized protein n=2 Tax=Oryza TaxID=4527 RepID=A0A0E0DX05_9ORYZ